jgi:iron(II)-dependent oxidoreductase
LNLETPLKCIRGGAFDTYFDNQAACQFQSGENPLNRRHNIGFRCAIGVGDVLLVRNPGEEKPAEAVSVAAEENHAEAEELQLAGADAG